MKKGVRKRNGVDQSDNCFINNVTLIFTDGKILNLRQFLTQQQVVKPSFEPNSAQSRAKILNHCLIPVPATAQELNKQRFQSSFHMKLPESVVFQPNSETQNSNYTVRSLFLFLWWVFCEQVLIAKHWGCSVALDRHVPKHKSDSKKPNSTQV